MNAPALAAASRDTKSSFLSPASAYTTMTGEEAAAQVRIHAYNYLMRADCDLPPEVAAEFVRELVDAHGIDLNADLKSGFTSLPLLCALRSGFINIAAAMVRAGARVEKPNQYNETAKDFPHWPKLATALGLN